MAIYSFYGHVGYLACNYWLEIGVTEMLYYTMSSLGHIFFPPLYNSYAALR